MIDKASEENLKNNIDIVDIISNYIEIKKAGANFKANCPFHGENTPSFVISPQKQIYHCFGCGCGGDSIQFVIEYEKLNYLEALEKIASIMNFSLDYTKGTSDYNETRRVLEQVQDWYSKTLNSNSIAKKYILDRGITQQSIETFGIGFVGKSQELMNFLSANFLPIPKAEEAGVVAERDRGGGFYARLVERITFPIYSASGSIVGFGGRTITNHPAKYINSPQTKLFNKSQLLYGYSKAKEHIYRNKKLIVCEGYLDVIMFHQAGFKEAVATLGTALTEEHLPILRKGQPSIILAYDGDKAGVSAALKAAIMLTKSGFDGSVVLFPNGADTEDMIAGGKIEEVANLLKAEQPLIPFVIEMYAKSYNLQNPIEKERAFFAINSYLDNLSPILKESYISHSAIVLGISPIIFTSSSSKSNYNLPAKVESKKVHVTTVKDDSIILSIIKTLYEKKVFINDIISIVDSSMFDKYAQLFDSVVHNDKNSSKLTALIIDDKIRVMEDDEFTKSIRNFLIKHYKDRLKKIPTDNSLPIMKKSFLIRKIKMDILPQLQSGELVSTDFGIL